VLQQLGKPETINMPDGPTGDQSKNAPRYSTCGDTFSTPYDKGHNKDYVYIARSHS
jgi:hypothetical protein